MHAFNSSKQTLIYIYKNGTNFLDDLIITILNLSSTEGYMAMNS